MLSNVSGKIRSSVKSLRRTTSSSSTSRSSFPKAMSTKSQMPVSNAPFQVENGIEKSLADLRHYKSVTLDNKLQVLLVSDPRTDKSAAAMDVNVGHFSDPDNIPGLAHFLEHMLFLGTKKYPDENSYSAFLNENGGRSNAFTSMEHTNYFFDVTHPHLEEALDRFAQFFIAPLFTPSATDRELNAVDSEHSKNVQDDMWRMFQLEKTTSSASHPYKKFATGNSATLKTEPEANGVDVRDALVKFHDKYYSANRMKLVVLGREPLDTLESWVRGKFADVVNSDAPVPTFSGFPFSKEELGRRIDVVPVKELRTIELTFPMAPVHHLYQNAPNRYVANLIGHEGPGSILSILKQNGWANELGASLAFNNSDFAFFKVNVDATDEGMQHVNDIIGVVFDYINLMRAKGPQQWFWEELAAQFDCEFRFKSESQPFNFVSTVAGNMQKYPEHHILSGPSLAREYDASAISHLMDALTPDNCQVMVAHKSAEATATDAETWYKTKYSIRPLDAALIKQWSIANFDESSCALHLPPPNEFIPTDFTVFDFEAPKPVGSFVTNAQSINRDGELKSLLEPWSQDGEDASRPPIMIRESENVKVWYKQDVAFKRPKLSVIVTVRTPMAYETPTHSVMAELYTLLVQDALNEFAYAAELAGLSYNLSHSVRGMTLMFGGFGHKLEALVIKVIDTMLSPNFSADQFDRFKERIHKQYKNWSKEQPYNHCVYNTSYLLNVPRWHIHDKLKTIEGDAITLDAMNAYVPKLFQESSLEMLIHGNVRPDKAIELSSHIEKEIARNPIREGATPTQRVVRLVEAEENLCVFRGADVENPNSAVEVVYQIGMESRKLEALVQLLAHVAQEPCFNILRTEEQLGYIVFCGTRNDVGVLALRIIIQSSKADPITLDSRIELFLKRLRTTLGDMDASTFEANVNAVAAQKLEKDKMLFAESRRWWGEIDGGVYAFSRNLRIAQELRAFKKSDLIDFFDEYVANGAPSRKKLMIGVVSGAHTDSLEPASGESSHEMNPSNIDDAVPTAETMKLVTPGAHFITNMSSFKQQKELYPARPQVGKL